jgi:hypothetical protein
MILSDEQWKRLQEMGAMNGKGPGGNAPSGTKPATDPKSNPPQS